MSWWADISSISKQVMEYCCGLYGRPPAPIDPKVMELVLKYYRKTANTIVCRPADLLPPEMGTARDFVKDFTQDEGDILIAPSIPSLDFGFPEEEVWLKLRPLQNNQD